MDTIPEKLEYVFKLRTLWSDQETLSLKEKKKLII